MRAEKEHVIDELKAKIEGASALIFTNYNGTSAEQMGALRTQLYERKGGYLVVKNRLFALAAKAAGLDGELPGFGGQVGVAFSDEESSLPLLKALVEFNKQNEVPTLLGGIIGGRPCTAEELKDLSKLPSKAAMRAQALGMLLAVPRALATVLAGRLRSVLYLLKARIEAEGGVPVDEPAQAPAETPAEAPAEASAEPTNVEPAGEAGA
ncbi:MAG: 50S ribosomal protein L10 [Verrucomicrobia bacterium]|nr:50S ribosomal protein L10 [Verrucomicrobiota bacterium]